jgi:hypothetical protein
VRGQMGSGSYPVVGIGVSDVESYNLFIIELLMCLDISIN